MLAQLQEWQNRRGDYLVLVPVHACQRTDMCENVLQGIGQLERIYITETELDMRIDDEFGQTKNLSTQMECISEARLLTLLRCQSPACTYERKTHY